jgi:hypothetical protein
MKKRTFYLSILGTLVIFGGLIYYFFFNYETCLDEQCFRRNLGLCSKATYITEGEFTFQYRIIGERNGECIVDVRLLLAGLERKFDSMVGKSMQCSLPLRKLDPPEEDMEYCSGPLKEEIQYIAIKDMYRFISQNVGK